MKINIPGLTLFFLIFFLFLSPGFSFQESEIPLQERSFDSLQKSLLIPGWGQFAEKKYLEGSVFLSMELFCFYEILKNNHRGNKNYALYKAAGTVDDAVRYRDAAETFDRRRNTFILGAIGIWALNLFDMYLIIKKKKALDKSVKIQIESGGNKMLVLSFTYLF